MRDSSDLLMGTMILVGLVMLIAIGLEQYGVFMIEKDILIDKARREDPHRESSQRQRMAKFVKPDDAILKEMLTDLQYEVTQHNATEPVNSGIFYTHFARGIYVDIVSKEPLFSSVDKYECPCG
ncbi:unnamed protein product [Didymodactylos carnosus]|uniref:MsrB domain-containing protein n=1 Tax=Didymodactylos carnosus TaxID=1234261 RepID=A0A8S2GYN4_9BILA|nr:unnamed protein product [Didymodactylos carnosus]CAF3580013.1 unnamed protein product [Didymodactylos carnosus]